MKRQDYITWDEYFMGVAKLSGMRSKDPNTQVGACIVSNDNKILSMGYNGFPIGCSDDVFPWDKYGEEEDTKYPYVTHSELNAILTIGAEALPERGFTFPCSPATNARRPSFRAGSGRSCMSATNTRIRLPYALPSGCWTRRGCVTGNMSPAGRTVTISL